MDIPDDLHSIRSYVKEVLIIEMRNTDFFKNHSCRPLAWRLAAVALSAGLLLAGCAGGKSRDQAPDGEDEVVTVAVTVKDMADAAGTAAAGAQTADPASSDEVEVIDHTGAAGTGAFATTIIHADSEEKTDAGHTTSAAASTQASASQNNPDTDIQESGAASTQSSAVQNSPGTKAQEGSTFSAEGKGLVIVLDPGHSAQVPGTTEPIGPGSSEMKEADTVGTYGPSSATHEYELTMRVTQKLRTELEKRGYIVRLTHLDTVRAISCVERAQVANENEADAFIRIHANGVEDTSASGAMTICITQDNPFHPELYKASYRLSETLLDAYCAGTGARREKVWETDTMTGNNWSEVPATLIELGYMTNPDEDLLMAMDSYQKKMVIAIADGLDQWFAQMPDEEKAMHPVLTGEKSPEEVTGADQAGQASPAAGSPAVDSPAAGTPSTTGTPASNGVPAVNHENGGGSDSAQDTGSTQDSQDTVRDESGSGQDDSAPAGEGTDGTDVDVDVETTPADGSGQQSGDNEDEEIIIIEE